MKRFMMTLLVVSVAATGGCGSTFVASKDGKGYYLGSGSDAAYKMFCESGDLRKILDHTTRLPQSVKDDLYLYNCGAERSNDRIKEVYAAMTPEQRKDLRQAFKNNGYDINAMRC